jgi:small conductance mechanosensitive channel
MFQSTYLHRFLSNVSIEDILIFIMALVTLTLITKSIKYFSVLLSKQFPTKRMLFLCWIPLFNFIVYLGGIIITIFIVFQPRNEVAIGLLASGLIAIGFAIKNPVSSIIAGIILLLDKPFQVGDRISFKDSYGEIVDIGLYSVKLLTLDSNLVTIPNHRFLTDTVSSSSAGELGIMATVDVYVSPYSDLLQTKNILEKVARDISYVDTSQKIIVVSREILGIAGIVSVEMKTKCIIKDSRTERAFQTEFLIQANKEFKSHNIKQSVN